NGMRNAAICLSDDNGVTWTKPRQLYTSKFTDAVNGKTNEFGFYGNFISSGKGLTTFDGTVMFTNNCLTYENKTSPQCYILSSKDEGETWTIGPSNAYKGCDESKLEQLNDGRLMVSVRQSGDRGFNTGTADASQWSSQWRNSQITGNACNADILYFSRATEGKMDILLHTYIKSSSRENLTLAMSIDQGLTWHDVLNIQPGGSCYSTMIKLANDDLAILYEDESYSVGNGYALNFVTITREQLEAFARQLGAEDEGDAYQRAMQSLQDGGVYMISTSFLNDKEANGSFYLKADGTLTEDESEAKFFTFQCKPIANGFKAAGWKSGQFTNPTNISTNTQFIRRDAQNRNDWEAQVILQDEETDLYAIRATNAPTENTWGANAFWTTDAEGHATYDLKGGEHYIWKIVKVGDTPTFDETQTYRIRSCEQGGYLIINNDGNLGGYYAGWDVYAQDFTIQPVANELGAFTIKDAHANRYIGTPNDKGEWNISTTASPCRIQRIEADGKYVYYIQAPFSYGYANASLHCLAYPVEDIAGDFGVVSYAKNGKECHWDILTTEEALALNVKNPSSVDENQDIFIFSPSGIRLTKMQRGFNIVRQKNGQVMKYMMK
ncbi:MAG: exo-alpha-sialidase, partial [Prevotella sp.]|nr:exo-alpha-sialidase [Prevotella sp.]